MFPEIFCSARLIKNKEVAERDILMWLSVCMLVKYFMALPKSKWLVNNRSCDMLVAHLPDKLVILEMYFFKHFASMLNFFLRRFQASSPMVPFVCHWFDNFLENLMNMFILQSKIDDLPRLIKQTNIFIFL